MNSFFKQTKEGLFDILLVWRDEFKDVMSDAAVILLFFAAPLLYPVIYSLIYNNEVAKEAKMVVVDYDNSPESREFRRLTDASRDVKIVGIAANMEGAKRALKEKEAYGIMYIPRDFSKKIANREKSYIQLYTDMSSLLYYKCFLLTMTNVSLDMNKDIQISRMSNSTEREEEIATQPIEYEDTAYFNPQSGFASFLIPGFLMLLIQQTLIIGICVLAGSSYDKKLYHRLSPIFRHKRGTFRIIFGKSLCYLMIYAVLSTYLIWVIPTVFSLPRVGNPLDIISFMLPYLLACIFFGFSISIFIKEKETAYVLLVFLSIFLLFISGLSWPASAVPWYWKALSYFFPSTFGIQGFVKMNSMGATLPDITLELSGLWAQVVCYFITACLVIRYRIKEECV